MRTAVIADDSAFVRKAARVILEALGFDCREARNGRETLDICHEDMPTLLLLDWEMPELDGIGVATTLRAEPGRGPIILFCSTHNDLDHIQQALSAGSDEYVMKPFDRTILEDKLRSIGLVN
ncbi:MAG: two-component system response regulator [Rhodospirillales bacterium 20-64-7]|nr:MAG: two-component system response regulator [Rhodospirillales bacterium 20-64-7]HQT76091.1 response regulator [Rhodopila sp.]